MRYLFSTIFVIICVLFATTEQAFSQIVNFSDGFEDGDFTSEPAWSGDTTDFAVTKNTPNKLLQLDASSSGSSYLSTSSTLINGIWQFYIEFQGFEPSGSNQANIFLMSNTSNLEGPVNGYAVQIGESGDDVFKIVRYDNGTEGVTIISDTTVIDDKGGGYTVKVTRSNSGNWHMEVGKGYGGPLYDSGNTGTDNTYPTASYFGPKIKFSSSRSDKFSFDFKIDLPPFTITKATADSAQIDVSFNRAYDQSTVEAADFIIDHSLGSPQSVSFPSSTVVRLKYGRTLASKEYLVSAQNIQDKNGNDIANSDSASFINFDTYAPDDVIINEFLYDPANNQSEYVELKNTTSKYLNLQNWQLGDESGNDTISSDVLTLQPNGFLVISDDTTTLASTYGLQPYVQLGSAPAFNNSGDVVKVLTGNGDRVDSLRYNNSWGGSHIALERRSDSVPSIDKENFGDSPNTLGGTPGQANEVTDDTTPPDLTGFVITNDQTLKLNFTERLAKSTATNPGNYTLDNGISVSSATQTAGDSVQLSLSGSLQNGVQYHFSIDNQQDIFSNTAATIDTTFNFYMVSPPDSGDIFINEFMYAPPNDNSEYIELYNPTSKSFDLNGWTINDNRGNATVITSGQYIVPPDSFVVIAPDNSLQTNYPDILLISAGTNFPSLNNGGDAIVLRDSTGQRLDSLTYISNSGGAEVALERRTTDVPPVTANFGEAPNGFGTPGSANKIGPDTIPPVLQSFTLLTDQSIQFVFTENVTAQSATITDNYDITSGLSVSNATLSGQDTVQLSLSGPLQNNTSYITTINGVQDRFGNAIVNCDTSFTYYQPSRADSGDVFINEFTYDPPDQGTEYVELYNTSSKSLDLNGWTLNDNSGNRQVITSSSFIIPPDSFVVIAPNNTLLNNYSDIALISMASRFPSLNNDGDNIVIRRADGGLLDSLSYNPAFGGANRAVERRTTNASSVKANFADAPNGFGTPGSQNQIDRDATPPHLINFAIRDKATLSLAFSEDLKNGPAINPHNYTLNHNISVKSSAKTAGDTVHLSLNAPLQNAVSYQLTIQHQQDIFGNTAASVDTSFTYYQISLADSGDVFINEFTYDPPEGSTEYIELYNSTSHSFDIKNWTLNDNTGNRQTISRSPFIIPPDSFVVIAPDQTLLKNNPDIPLVSMGSLFPSLNNNGDDIVLCNAAGKRLDSLRYTSDWNGNEIALERRTITVDPVQANFGNAPNQFGTPGEMNNIAQDEVPPDLASFSILNEQSLELVFTEGVEQQSAIDADHYQISGDLSIRSVILAGHDTLRINLSGPLQNNTRYTTSIDGINDLFGNTLSNRDTTFTYFKVSPVTPDNVFVNEFMYNPPTGQAEYIELRNPTDKSLNMQNWTINDNTGKCQIITPNQYILPPDSFVVIAPDNTLLTNNPVISLLRLGSRFPSFNNSGDDIVLRDSTGQLLDSLRYTNAWGGHRIALERRTINTPAVKENFGDAPNGFGTPGKINDIQLDNNPPTLHTLQILDNSTIQLILSEAITGQTATNEDNYRIVPKRDIQLISAVQDTITLFLSQQLQSGQNYQIEVSGLQDAFGNTITEITQGATFVQYTDAQPGSIVINEILYRRESADDPEFVELYNPTVHNYKLINWKIGDASSTAIIDTNLRLRAGEYAVLTDNASLANSLDNAVYLSNFPSLNDDGDAVYIQNNNSVTIDSLFYHAGTFGGNTDGKSAERKDPAGPSNDASNFATSTLNTGSTPGAKNSVFKQDDIPPTIKFARILPDGTIAVHFNEFIALNKDVRFSINDEPLSVVSFDPHEANIIILNSPADINSGSELTLKAGNLTDVKGNADPSSTPSATVAQLIKKGAVVINEILYDPINDSDDNQPDQSEYIELKNTQNYTISLKDINLHDAPDENGDTHILKPVSTDLKYISPGGTALVYAGETRNFIQSRMAKFFSLSDQSKNTLMRINRSTLSLASSNDAIYLTANNKSIDSVFYDESWQNQNLVDTKGIALERINPEGPSNDASNWGSSTDKRGGTPNEENTIYQAPGQEQQQDIGIYFSPNPFSPDDDGTDDRLFINYKLDNADYLITVNIYDRYGRLVRELADGKPASFTGSLIWDGLKDNGTRNRIGIYIVIFKAFDSAEGKNKVFKKTVVLARRLN